MGLEIVEHWRPTTSIQGTKLAAATASIPRQAHIEILRHNVILDAVWRQDGLRYTYARAIRLVIFNSILENSEICPLFDAIRLATWRRGHYTRTQVAVKGMTLESKLRLSLHLLRRDHRHCLFAATAAQTLHSHHRHSHTVFPSLLQSYSSYAVLMEKNTTPDGL